MHQRVSVLALALSLFAALSAWEVVRGHRQEPLHSRLPMAVVFAVMAIFLRASRGRLSWFQPSGPGIESFYDAMGDVVPLVTSIGIVCINIGLMMMATERLSSRYRKRALTDELTDLPNRGFSSSRPTGSVDRPATGSRERLHPHDGPRSLLGRQ